MQSGVHTQTYSFLEISGKKVKNSPHLQFSRNFQKFPQKIKSLVTRPTIKNRKLLYLDSRKLPLPLTQTYKETFLDSRKFPLPITYPNIKLGKGNLKFLLCPICCYFSVLQPIQIKGPHLDQRVPQQKSIYPIGLISARIQILHSGSFFY